MEWGAVPNDREEEQAFHGIEWYLHGASLGQYKSTSQHPRGPTDFFLIRGISRRHMAPFLFAYFRGAFDESDFHARSRRSLTPSPSFCLFSIRYTRPLQHVYTLHKT